MNPRSLPAESLDEVRLRILHETEDALLYGLLHPESAPRIPRVEVGQAAFSPAFARAFWSELFGGEDERERPA